MIYFFQIKGLRVYTYVLEQTRLHRFFKYFHLKFVFDFFYDFVFLCLFFSYFFFIYSNPEIILL